MDEKFKKSLPPALRHIAVEKGTEPPFSGAYNDFKGEGRYRCAVCGADLFSSEAKYDSSSGWPSFTDPASSQSVVLKPDSSLGMTRTEVVCRRCGAHLGHVFDDGSRQSAAGGPPPTGKRYCVNSLSLDFVKGKQREDEQIL